MNNYLNGAQFRGVSYRGEAPLFRYPPWGWILHVQQGDGSPVGHFESLRPPNRAFSHLWVGKSGQMEQYQSLDRVAWHAGDGNARYWGVETEGFTTQALTRAQIVSLGRIHNALGARDSIAALPGQVGIGTHSMGGAAYGGHACPGPVRAGQRLAVIAEAAHQRQPVQLSPVAPQYHQLLKAGSTGSYVAAVQRQLVTLGFHLAVDGDFGPNTLMTVRAFQRSRNLAVDGVVGPATWGALWAVVAA